MIDDKCQILKILRKTNSALNKKDYLKIKFLSNEVIHCTSVEQDPDIISVAVILYSLSKLIERESYKTYEGWQDFYKNFIKNLNQAINALDKKDIQKFRDSIAKTRFLIEDLTGNLKNYISEVFRKSQINKASKIYENGISMEKTAKILGISVWELAEYAGQAGIGDIDLSITLPIKERIKYLEEFF